MHVLLGPRHFRNVDEAFNAVFQFNKRTVIRDVGNPALDLGANGIALDDDFPWILVELLHAQ